jgi:adenylate cyclase
MSDHVTTGVVAAVVPKVDQAEIQRAKRKPVGSVDAYDVYLRGMAKTYEFTKEAHEEAHRLFYRAIELDPDFVTPYAMAVRLYGARKVQGWMGDRDWEAAETKRLALRISAIGRDDAFALSWAGHALVWVCYDDVTGARLLDEALSINQNSAVAWQLRGSVSLFLGQPEDAAEQTVHALRLNPLDPASFLSETTMATAS